MAMNVKALFFLMQDACKSMIAAGNSGTIVNIGSTSERAGRPLLSPYSTIKGALATLTRNSGFALCEIAAELISLISAVWHLTARARLSLKSLGTLIGNRKRRQGCHLAA